MSRVLDKAKNKHRAVIISAVLCPTRHVLLRHRAHGGGGHGAAGAEMSRPLFLFLILEPNAELTI